MATVDMTDHHEEYNMDKSALADRFTFHPADTVDKQILHATVRGICLEAAQNLNDLLPEGREKSLALTHLEETMFWSNAAVARSE